MDKVEMGKQIQKYREKAGYSQETLAELINRSSIFISCIERGEKSPGLETLINIANVFNVSLDVLIGNEVKRNPVSRLSYIEDKIFLFPSMEQKRILDVFESMLDIELQYMSSCKGGE